MASRLSFHERTGSLVSLTNDGRTAQRNQPVTEFNNGVVVSSKPLQDNQLFEVRIDKKVPSWSGCIEIGITTFDPEFLNFPTSATGFREGTWVMSGSSILKDGHSTVEEFGRDLDQLGEGDRVGVMRTSGGNLHFYVNGIDQGCAASSIPSKVFGVIDMYGKCAQVTIVDEVAEHCNNREIAISNDLTNEAIAEAMVSHSNDRLLFHERCGTLVKLSNNRRTSERTRPLDEFNNGVVMTDRPIRDNELFEIRLDRLVDKWSGSIEVGISTHNPNNLDFPATMTNMRTAGTIMMSGCGILTNGKGTRREYGEYNLDELSEGDRIGLMRKSDGTLHYYINGNDQGCAASRTPSVCWGVVDLYGMAVKVTILDPNERPSNSGRGDSASMETRIRNSSSTETLATRLNNELLRQFREELALEEAANETRLGEADRLKFHTHCGSHAAVISDHRTAHRPNALDDFNNGVVLTHRILLPGEMFEIRLDKMVDKWAGSIEIGVTTHTPSSLDFPTTMTNMRSGTWMMTGSSVMHNGTTVIDEYGQNLDRLKVSDRVGVLRNPDGTLHFYINGIDQGVAGTSVPANVYGVIDLYGQAAQATIIDLCDPSTAPCEAIERPITSDGLYFHHLHGRNTTITSDGKTASRPNARGEFNDAIIMSNRPLRTDELFEVRIDKMVDRWSGSIEAGLTSILPDELTFPNTMTDLEYGTWMLSGSAIMQDGQTIQNGYALDLDALTLMSRIGMMRCADGTLHYYLDGIDQGVACRNIPQDVYAVIDLYGQCAQVTITSNSGVRASENRLSNVPQMSSLASPLAAEMTHRFNLNCGKNIAIKNTTAFRVRNFNHGLVFSADPLKNDELFEVKVDQKINKWAGSLQIGLTSLAVDEAAMAYQIPACAGKLPKPTWLVSGSEVRKNDVIIKENYAPTLERIQVNDRVGIKRCQDSTMHLYLNGEDMGVAASNVAKNPYAVIDLYGSIESITATSNAFTDMYLSSRPPSLSWSDDGDSIEEDADEDTAESLTLNLHGNHGKNIQLRNGHGTAQRMASYNQGVIVSRKALLRNQMFRVRIDKLNTRWTSSLTIGVIGFSPDKFTLPVTAVNIKKSAWMVQGDSVFYCGTKIKEHYGPNLDSLQTGHIVGVTIDEDGSLHLSVNGVDQGVAATDLPPQCYAVIDLYGQCEQVTVVTELAMSESHNYDYREKADIEDGVKEKVYRNTEMSQVKNCEYQNMCQRFKATLGLPDGYFIASENHCFCQTCHKIRGDQPYMLKGEPPRETALPFGWCKFALRKPIKADSLNIHEKWHVAYTGTHPAVLRKVLDTGDVMMGDLTVGVNRLLPQPSRFDEKNKPDGEQDCKQITMSPTIRYAGSLELAPRIDFIDPKSGRKQLASVVLQLYVKPGSYKIGPQTICHNEQLDPHLSNNELEWRTKELGATILDAVLIKVEN